MEVHTYIVNPFADIICTTCQYVVKVNTSCTLFAALYQHERRNRNHPFPHDEDKRKVIAAQLQSQMKEVVMNVWSLFNEDINLANDHLLQYLSIPPAPFMYCKISEVLVKDRHYHKRGEHSLSCQQEKMGYKILNWEKKDPGIVLFPLNIHNQSIFGALFQAELSRLSSESSLAAVPGIVRGTAVNYSTPINYHRATNDQVDNNLVGSDFHLILEEQTQRYETGNENIRLHEVDQQAEPNPWLNRVGYDIVLSPHDKSDLKSLAMSVQDNDLQMQRISTGLTNTLWNVIL